MAPPASPVRVSRRRWRISSERAAKGEGQRQEAGDPPGPRRSGQRPAVDVAEG